MSTPLQRFETRLEHLVERLFSRQLDPTALLRAMIRAWEASLALHTPAQAETPLQVVLELHPADHSALLQQHPDLASRLSLDLLHHLRERGVKMLHVPALELVADLRRAPATVMVELSLRPTSLSTRTDKVDRISTAPPLVHPRAMLIAQGRAAFMLKRPIINLGRHADNHVVLEDPRISRWHCQIRLRHGRHTLYDLNSSHGTYVNHQRIVEHILQNGDVLSLGSVQLIYVEETEDDDAPGQGDTQAKHPLPRGWAG
ncbi:MAG: DUF3662 domain-containing protein [Anaerolineae bacterium]|nr:DUF3662 domain-containing protein [Anaerolineae bacterium]